MPLGISLALKFTSSYGAWIENLAVFDIVNVAHDRDCGQNDHRKSGCRFVFRILQNRNFRNLMWDYFTINSIRSGDKISCGVICRRLQISSFF